MRALLFMLLASMAMLAAPSAFAGSGYAPPASGGGVSGSGSGITDASSFRAALGLGTLATESGPYAADSWDYEWTAGASTMAADGWTMVGTPTDTGGTDNGITYRALTPPAGSTTAYARYTLASPPDGPFEWRCLCYLPASTSTLLYEVDVQSGAAGINRRAIFVTNSAGLNWYTTANNLSTAVDMAGLVNRWVWITMRVTTGGIGAPGVYQLWLGPSLVDYGVTSASTWRVLVNAGYVILGKGTATSGTAEMRFAKFQFRNGVNSAPVYYTFRSLNGAPGP